MNSRRDPYHTLETKLRSTIERGAAKPRSPFATTKQLPASCHCAPSACCSPAAAPRRRCSSPPLLLRPHRRCSSPPLLLLAAAAPRRCRCFSPLPLLLAAAVAGRCGRWRLHIGDVQTFIRHSEDCTRPPPSRSRAPHFKDPNVHPPFLLLPSISPSCDSPPLARVNLVF